MGFLSMARLRSRSDRIRAIALLCSQNAHVDAGLRQCAQLGAGNIFLVDFNEHRVIEDAELKKRYTGRYPYADWLSSNAFTLQVPPCNLCLLSCCCPCRVLLLRAHGCALCSIQL